MTIFARPEIGHGDQWWEVAAPDPGDARATALWESSTIEERKRAARQWFEVMLDLTSPSRGMTTPAEWASDGRAPTVTDIRELLDGIEKRAAEAERHVSPCGPCDGGLPMACTCATVDPRETISELITLTRAQNAALRAVLDLHIPSESHPKMCRACGYDDVPACPTVRAITEALGGGA